MTTTQLEKPYNIFTTLITEFVQHDKFTQMLKTRRKEFLSSSPFPYDSSTEMFSYHSKKILVI